MTFCKAGTLDNIGTSLSLYRSVPFTGYRYSTPSPPNTWASISMTGTNKVEVSTTGFSPIADPFRNSLKKRFSLPSHQLRWCTSFLHVFKTTEMVWSLPCKRSPSLLGVLWYRIDAYSPVEPLISKKYWIELLLFEKWSQKIAAAAILLGPKALRIRVRSQCEITRHGLSKLEV